MFNKRRSFGKSRRKNYIRRIKSVSRFKRVAKRVNPKNFVPRGGFRI